MNAQERAVIEALISQAGGSQLAARRLLEARLSRDPALLAALAGPFVQQIAEQAVRAATSIPAAPLADLAANPAEAAEAVLEQYGLGESHDAPLLFAEPAPSVREEPPGPDGLSRMRVPRRQAAAPAGPPMGALLAQLAQDSETEQGPRPVQHADTLRALAKAYKRS